MAIESAVNSVGYSGNNSDSTPYPITFRFDDPAWLSVIQVDDDDVTTILEDGVDYSVEVGGILTTLAVPATSTLSISRYTPASQSLDLIPNAPLPAEDVEAALDRVTMALQDRDAGKGNPFFKALTFPRSEPDSHETVLPLPHLRKNTLVFFNETTGELEVITMANLADAIASLVALSAYELAVQEGFVGDLTAWLASLAGAAGDDGVNGYTYLAYASDASGTDFTTTFDAALDYIAILSTDTEIPTPLVADFAGLWKNYRGTNGTNGTNGAGLPVGGAIGEMAYHNGTAWVVLANPGAPAANTRNIMTHDGTAPAWDNVAEIVLDYCDAGTPAVGTFLKL
jgi:hypothetical protein